MSSWSGVFPAALTHFKADESLDISGTMRHLDVLIDSGVHGLVMLGSLGENCSLEYGEKLDVLRASVEHVARRVPVLSGVAECSTRLACRFAADVERIGCDGLMVLPGMVYKADVGETMAHFRAVAASTNLPIMLYNNPVSYGIDLKPDDFADLADEPKFVAIKESSDDVRRITDLRTICGNRYRLFCGVDDLALEAMMLGADGWVAGLVNAFPAENRVLWDLADAGDFDEAVNIYRWYTPLLHLDTHTKLVQYIKLAAQECGLASEVVRAPRQQLVGSERERILGVIRRAIATRPLRQAGQR
jgi:4-hydroxy-tetrahydrodipicolinate synthase